MRKFLEILIFILISVTLGILISVPLFFFSTSKDIQIGFLNIGEINLYKLFVIVVFFIILIYIIISIAVDKFRQDEETRHFILRKYPPVISHILVFISQIIPSLIRFRFLLVIILIAFGIPRLLSLWLTNNVIGIEEVTWIDVILNIIITQLIIAPILIILLLNNYFDRERISSIDDYSSKDHKLQEETLSEEGEMASYPITDKKAEPIWRDEIESKIEPNSIKMFLKRILAGAIDFLFMCLVIALFVLVIYFILSMTLYSPNSRVVAGVNSYDIALSDYLVVGGIVAYLIFIFIQWGIFKKFNATLGKAVMKMKVVDVDRKSITMSKYLLRETILKSLGGILYYSWIFFFIKNDGNMLHDYLVGTKVIQT